MATIVRIDVMLARRKMSVTELARRVGITMANLSILKNGKARAIRFSTLEGICRALDCQPGDILEFKSDDTRSAVGSQTGDLASSSRRQRPRDAGTAVRPARG